MRLPSEKIKNIGKWPKCGFQPDQIMLPNAASGGGVDTTIAFVAFEQAFSAAAKHY